MLHILASTVVCKDLMDVHSSKGYVLQQDDPQPEVTVRKFEHQWCNVYTAHTQKGDVLMLVDVM